MPRGRRHCHGLFDASAGHATDADDGRVLTREVLRCAGEFGLTPEQLAATLGVSSEVVSDLLRSATFITAGSASHERGSMLVEIWRSLGSFTGGHASAARRWLRAPQEALGLRAPLELLVTADGLVTLCTYLRHQ